jgi:hypothetical protein
MKSAGMKVHVEYETGQRGEIPKWFRLNGHKVEIAENIDEWHGPDYRYVKVKGDDGNLYILRFDERQAEWELTMFQSPEAEAFSAPLYPGARRRGDGM